MNRFYDSLKNKLTLPANLLNLGHSNVTDFRLKRHLVLVNGISIYIGLADFLFALVFVSFSSTVGMLFLVCGLCYAVIIPFLNFFGFINLSRFLFAFFGQTILTLISFYLGENSYSHIPLLLGACTAFCMVSPKERLLILSTLLIPCVYFPLLYYFNFDLGFNVNIAIIESNIAIIRAVMWGFTFSFLAFAAYFFTSQANSYEESLHRFISNLNKEISAREEAEANLKQIQHKLNMLMGILTHDLANHSLTLSYYAKMLIEGQQKPDRLEQAKQRIYKNACGIEEMIENARHMQAVTAGLEKLKSEPVAVNQLLTKAEAIMNLRLQEKNLKLKIHSDLDLARTMVHCNETTFVNHILCNILSNAAKFSNQGGVVTIKIQRKDDQTIFAISDQGIGMPDDIINCLFELDKTSNRRGTEGEKGTGFGMPLCKYYCELFGGKIAVESREKCSTNSESGTTFVLSFNYIELHRV